MKYNFENIPDRRGTHAIAVDKIPIPGARVRKEFSKIPMWVADMNFATCPTIPEEMAKRVAHPLYGYFSLPDEYFEAIKTRQRERKGVEGLEDINIGYENGVLGGVVSAANVLASKGDPILVHSPTYIGFTNALTNSGFHLVHSPLYVDGDGIRRMDYEDMEKKIVDYKIHTAILCNPHNPTGRARTGEELAKAYEIFKRHQVYVISDEIRSDILLNGNDYTPSQKVSEDARDRTIAFYAPSKTFNLAGLVGSYHIVYNDRLRDRLIKESTLSFYNAPNVISVAALIGAYKSEGGDRVDQLNEVLSSNINFAYDFIRENFKGVKVQKPEATYLLYLDCTDRLKEHETTIDDLQKKGVEVGVIRQDGRPFGLENSIRMNLALPHRVVVDAFTRLKTYVF